MTVTKFTEQVRAALEKVASDRRLSEASEDTGIGRKIYDMRSRGTLNTDDTLALANWLRAHGYMEPDVQAPVEHPPDVSDLLARDLEILAEILRSPMPANMKTEVFAERVAQLYRGIHDYCDIIRKQQGLK